MPTKLPPHDSNGFYLHDGSPDPRGYYGSRAAPDEHQIEIALAYLSRLRPTKRATMSSYSLKHCAERWERHNGRNVYVSNGALIAAAIRLELTIIPHGINASIGVSRRDVAALDKIMRRARP
jgi:hypothetical protein